MNPILFVDLFRQASYKNAILLSTIHKQLTYFSKKYSKSTRITLSKTNKLSTVCDKDNIKAIKYVTKKINIMKYDNLVYKSAKFKNIKTVRHFLNNGYDIYCSYNTIKDYYGSTTGYITSLLLFCCRNDNNNTNIIKFLLNKGADVHENDEGPLRICAKSCRIDIIKLLLKYGANPHIYHSEPLVISAMEGHIKVVNLLLNYCASEIALYEAFRCCIIEDHIDVAELLLANGVDINSDKCDDILMDCIEFSKTKILKLLLKKGINVHAENDRALKICVMNNKIKKLKFLLNTCDYSHLTNNFKQNLIIVADSQKIITILKSHFNIA